MKPVFFRTSGVTLVEILIVFFITTILLMISIPSFLVYTNNQRLTWAAQSIFNALKHAKSAAMGQGNTVYFSFQTGSNWCYGENSNSACNCTVANACNLGVGQAGNSTAVTLSTSGIASSNIQFEPMRGASNVSSGYITVALANGKSISSKIDSLGNISLCSANLTEYPPC